MSTRRDGLSLTAVRRTVLYILDRHGVGVTGGNARVLHLSQRDSARSFGPVALLVKYGLTLEATLQIHGFTIRERRGALLVDLLQCDACAGVGERFELAEQIARQMGSWARTDWQDRHEAGEDPPGRSAGEYASEKADETYRWALGETTPRLRSLLAS